jgi:hypothetical protein
VLLAKGAEGKHIPTVELVGVVDDGHGGVTEVTHLKLDTASINGVASEAGHDTAVAFGFEKVSGDVARTAADGSPEAPVKFIIDADADGIPVALPDQNELAAFAHAHPIDQFPLVV